MSRKVLTLQSLNQQAGPVGRWDSDLAPHTTAVDTEHSPGHWRTLPPLHKWDTLLPQQNNIKLYGSTRVYWHSLSIYLSFLGGESDSSVTNDKVDIFLSNWIGSLVSILIYFPNESKLVKRGQNEIKMNKKYVVKHKSAKPFMTYAIEKLEAALNISHLILSTRELVS